MEHYGEVEEDIGTREKIVVAARKLFAEKSFTDTSVKDICDLADVNSSSVNYYFKTKKSLFDTIIKDIPGVEASRASEIFDDDPDTFIEFKIKVQLFCENFINSLLEHFDTISVFLRNLNIVKATTREQFDKFGLMTTRRLARFIATGQKAGYLKEHLNPHIASRYLIGSLSNHLERIHNLKAHFAGEDIVVDKSFRKKWLNDIVELFTSGLAK